MRSAKQSIGAYGAASAVFAGVIACAFVMGASIFGQDLLSLFSDLSCDSSPDCTAPLAASAAPLPIDSAGQLSIELTTLGEPPASAMPTNAMQTPR